ncbi:3-hydroxyacyl-ACP dehydratase FabZ family protein [Streptomyces sp. NPDC054841]
MTGVGIEEIKRRIPHRDPVLLVDRVTGVEPGVRLTAIKKVSAAEPSGRRVVDTLGTDDVDLFPTSLVLESWAQAAVLLACWDQPNPDVLTGMVELAVSLADTEVLRPVRAGDVLEHHVELTRVTGDVATLSGTCRADGQVVARIGELFVAARPARSLLAGRSGEQN